MTAYIAMKGDGWQIIQKAREMEWRKEANCLVVQLLNGKKVFFNLDTVLFAGRYEDIHNVKFKG
jgi:hypothetical protein